MRLIQFLLPAALLTNAYGQSGTSIIEFLHYQIAMPVGFKLSPSKTYMMDFELYDLLDQKGQVVAGVYVGCCSQFTFQKSIHSKRSLAPGLTISEAKANPAQKEFLIECDSVTVDGSWSPWPQVHVFKIPKNNSLSSTIYSAFLNIKVVKPELK